MVTVWTILLLLGALLMRAGLISYSFGTVRSKNAAGTVGRQILDWTVAVLAFWAVGLAIATARNQYFGFDLGNLLGDLASDQMHLLLGGLAAASVVGTMAIGATAERSRLWPMLVLSLVTAAFTLPVVMLWTGLRGWITLNLKSFPGPAYIHLIGGTAALVAIQIIGPREGKYNRDGSTSIITGHNLPAVLSGAFLTFIGGLLMTCTAGTNAPVTAAVNILLSTAASVLVSAIYCQIKFAKLDLPVLAASLIAGMVAASASPGSLPGWHAAAGGTVAGLIVVVSLVWIDFRFHLDDVSGAVSIHGVAGAWALIVAAAHHGEKFRGRAESMLMTLASIAAIVVLTAVVTFVTLKVVSLITPLRSKPADEFDGLDIAEHDTAGYPDFQQNSIR